MKRRPPARGTSIPPPSDAGAVAARRAWRRMVIRFILIFAIVFAFFMGITTLDVVKTRLLGPFLVANAHAATWVLHVFGESDVAASGTFITSASRQVSMTIQRGCDAVDPIALFVAAMLAFPGSWRRKEIAIAAGVALLITLNFIRILSLYVILAWKPEQFHFVHVELWQPIFVIVALAAWLFAASRLLPRRPPAHPAPETAPGESGPSPGGPSHGASRA